MSDSKSKKQSQSLEIDTDVSVESVCPCLRCDGIRKGWALGIIEKVKQKDEKRHLSTKKRSLSAKK